MSFQMTATGGPAQLCLPLLKFSYATVASGSVAPIPWIHLSSRNDLFAAFDTIEHRTASGVVERQHRFRVLQDPEVLEDIDLEVLATEAQRAVTQAQASLGQRYTPHITIVVRDPCIAMRYPSSEGMIRRFQIRFAHQPHFYEAMGILTKAGVPVSEAGIVPSAKPQLTPQQTSVGGFQYGKEITNFEPTIMSTAPGRDGHARVNRCENSNPGGLVHTQNYIPHTSEARPLSHSQTLGLSTIGQRYYEAINAERSQTAHSALGQSNRYAADSLAATVTNLTSSQPQHLQPSAIDLYIPRPATAPVLLSSVTDGSMPPKRELPFVRKEIKASVREKIGDQCDPDACHAKTSDIGSNVQPTIAEAPPLQEQTTVTKTSNKRAASKPKKPPAAKKQRNTTSRSKASIKDKAIAPRTATVDKTTTAVNAEGGPSDASLASGIDTQALLTKAEAKLANFASTIITKSASTRPGAETNTPNCDPDQLVDAHEQVGGDVNQHSVKDAQVDDQRLMGAESTSLHEHDVPLIQLEQNSRTSSLPATKELDENINNGKTSSSEILGGIFDKTAASKLAEFSNMSKQEQHQILESFICRTIDDDNFITLCKSLEGVWQRALCLK